MLGAAPGQDYDVWARFLARHLPRHIPGNPTFIVQNMPGAGHMRAANWLYNLAPRDGTVWGSVSRNIPAVGLQQLSGVQFDPLKFNWIGSPEQTNRGCIAMAKNPRVQSAADLFEHELVVGGTGAGSTVTETPKLLRGLLGMKFKVVEGYAKPQDGQFAMERGELDGMCATVQSLRNFRPDWIKSGTARVLFTLEQEPVPWTKAPTIYQFVKTDEQRKTLEYFSSSIEYGRPLLLPPEVPAERVQMLRRAFEATVNDPPSGGGAQTRHGGHAAHRRATGGADPRGEGNLARDHRAGDEDHPVAGELMACCRGMPWSDGVLAFRLAGMCACCDCC